MSLSLAHIENTFKTKINYMSTLYDVNKLTNISVDDLTSNKLDYDIISIKNENNKLMMKGKYKIIGMYNKNTSIWYWAWDIDFVDKNLIIDSLKFKEAAKNIKLNSPENESIYFYLTTGNFMTNIQNLTLIIKLALYITDGIWFYKIIHNENINNVFIEYVILTGITENNIKSNNLKSHKSHKISRSSKSFKSSKSSKSSKSNK